MDGNFLLMICFSFFICKFYGFPHNGKTCVKGYTWKKIKTFLPVLVLRCTSVSTCAWNNIWWLYPFEWTQQECATRIGAIWILLWRQFIVHFTATFLNAFSWMQLWMSQFLIPLYHGKNPFTRINHLRPLWHFITNLPPNLHDNIMKSCWTHFENWSHFQSMAQQVRS